MYHNLFEMWLVELVEIFTTDESIMQIEYGISLSISPSLLRPTPPTPPHPLADKPTFLSL